MRRFVQFALVGGIGFIVDAGLLALLLASTPFNPLFARIASIGGALAVTWALNRHLTFSPSSRGPLREGSRYGGVGLASALFNYLVYSSLLLVVPAISPLVALVIASLAAMGFSFFGYTRLVFDR